jgi:hypothetical protein
MFRMSTGFRGINGPLMAELATVLAVAFLESTILMAYWASAYRMRHKALAGPKVRREAAISSPAELPQPARRCRLESGSDFLIGRCSMFYMGRPVSAERCCSRDYPYRLRYSEIQPVTPA